MGFERDTFRSIAFWSRSINLDIETGPPKHVQSIVLTDLDNLLLGDDVRQTSHVNAVTRLRPIGGCILFVRSPGVGPIGVVVRGGAVVPPVVASVRREAVVRSPVTSTFAFVISAPACRLILDQILVKAMRNAMLI